MQNAGKKKGGEEAEFKEGSLEGGHETQGCLG
jgi:hypothetical protein